MLFLEFLHVICTIYFPSLKMVKLVWFLIIFFFLLRLFLEILKMLKIFCLEMNFDKGGINKKERKEKFIHAINTKIKLLQRMQ